MRFALRENRRKHRSRTLVGHAPAERKRVESDNNLTLPIEKAAAKMRVGAPVNAKRIISWILGWAYSARLRS
jgi:hypothetical protein